MLTALARLNDVDGAEMIFEEFGVSKYMLRHQDSECDDECTLKEWLLKSRNELGGSIWDRLAYGYYRNSDMDNAIQTMKKAILADQPKLT
ncbi:hypothetical protein HN51_052893 [Arachis hypogaea]|uniref:Uncharacterized protein n=1 Tax=Arachis hypogaea TaxID=3818 RepID=A0A445C8V5_ARAHY|nr:hypothetical protein Ahy_A07g033316 [Arachis hypogaea]